MHQGGSYATFNHYQYDQSQIINPNPNPNLYDSSYSNSFPAPVRITSDAASAPPISPNYSSFSPPDYTHVPHSAHVGSAPSNPASFDSYSHQPSFDSHSYQPPPPPYHSYDQNQNQNRDQYQPVLNYGQPSGTSHSPDPNLYSSSQYDHQGAALNGTFPRDEPRQYDYHGAVSNDGVYAYKGNNVEPYGARGTGSQSSGSSLAFDDYGRPIRSNSSGKEQGKSAGSSGGVTKAAPKSEMQQGVQSGVQKFRVTLLAETGGQTNMDVLCQVGLDGIRMLEHSTSRTLQIYPLEMITKCEVLDSLIFAFWSRTSVDVEPRRIRLKSNSYTTNIILDAVTAATIQLKEMNGLNKPSYPTHVSDQLAEKKKGLGDWINLIKPKDEEKDHWVPDEAVKKCNACATDFVAFMRRHHCRNCGDIFCDKCTQGRIALNADDQAQPVRVCDQCMAEVTQRLSNAKVPPQVAGLHRHEDLAKKLQEEMDRKRQTSSGTKYDGSRMQMREVACPTCTVHLEVEVPNSGSKTIECSVCQHPFLVNAQ